MKIALFLLFLIPGGSALVGGSASPSRSSGGGGLVGAPGSLSGSGGDYSGDTFELENALYTEKYLGKNCALCNLSERSTLGQGDIMRVKSKSICYEYYDNQFLPLYSSTNDFCFVPLKSWTKMC